jgi:short-subunit dehydrogenase
VLAADLGDRTEVERVAAECAHVDILVANAALPASGPLLDFSPEQIDRALEVNLRAPVMLARLMAEQMAERGAGHLVFVSSLMGKTATPSSSIYAATKFGLRGFGRGLRADLAPLGIGVSVVFPGFIRDAGMFHDSGANLPSYVGTSTAEDVAEHVREAIEHDKGEVDVAPIPVRAGVKLAELAPGLAGKVTERLGSRHIADQMSAGQSGKR